MADPTGASHPFILTTEWRAPLDGRVAEAAMAYGERLALAVLEQPDETAEQLAERALLEAHLAQVRPRAGHEKRALTDARAAYDVLAVDELPPDLFGGRAGIGWMVDRALHLLGAPPLTEDDPIDRMLAVSPWLGEFDLISGLVGFGVRALSRSHGQTVRLVVERLTELAEPQRDGVAWRTPANRLGQASREKFPAGVLDLSMAHGIAGVIAFLAEADPASALLEAAVEWMLAQRLSRDDLGCFSSWIYGDSELPAARSAWCYGAPGIAAALLRAARRRNHARWEREAVDIASASSRRPLAEARVADAALCHGAAGLGQIYARLFSNTGDESFRSTSRAWFERALEMPTGDDRSFLTGSTGIALALFSAALPLAPSWDGILLLDL